MATLDDATRNQIRNFEASSGRPMDAWIGSTSRMSSRPVSRLERATGMCTHRVRLDDPAAFDAEVRGWLREAYDRAG